MFGAAGLAFAIDHLLRQLTIAWQIPKGVEVKWEGILDRVTYETSSSKGLLGIPEESSAVRTKICFAGKDVPPATLPGRITFRWRSGDHVKIFATRGGKLRVVNLH